ncbi:MAG: tRNA (adenosine(37)-N6)-threonylcarbamoyltransferase complex dimerization subunit type 1 TsaB [Nitrospira sp.]|nr:tRNA (adenosine(37)-N6)-threonylcarbamoyltransferase complex dimerization subunit type 1 TsaB [Nitrospira sp.]
MTRETILAVETATSWQSVAIVEDEGVVAQEQHDVGVRHGLTLLSTIDRMLKQTGLLLTDLDGLACSIGPGSFTGIRVGLATCLGLRMATGLPLMVIPTLEAMAFMVQKRTSTASLLCPILPGRSGELYWALFKSGEEGQLERVMQERVGPPEAVGASLSTDTMVFGGGWSTMEAHIRMQVAPSVTFHLAPEGCERPSAVAVGLLGLQKLRAGKVAGDSVVPLYVQRAEAEIVYERSGGISPAVRRQERVMAKIARRQAKKRQPQQSAGCRETSHDGRL